MTRIKSRIVVFILLYAAFLGHAFAKTDTSVTITSWPNPSTYGETVTFTATVTPSSASGSVAFKDGTTTIGSAGLSNGVATYSTSALAIGSHSMTAVYAGNSSYNGSTSSPALTQVVNRTPTSVTLTSNHNPSTYGSTVTFSASVSPIAATGTVTFMDGSTTLGTSSLGGGTAKLANYMTSALIAGSHSITATYNGDSNYDVSTSSALAQVVNKANPALTLASSSNPSSYASPVTFTAAISPSIATGTVTFMDGSTTLGTGTISGGNATYSTAALTTGSHSISATYAGDANDNGSTSSSLTQVINQANSSLTLASSSNPTTYGTSVTLTATVSPALATGTVTFLDGGTAIGTNTISAGQATYTTSALGVGSHSITATYAGDANDSGSTASALTQIVNEATSSVTLASSSNPTTYATSVTFTATIAPQTATGKVTFFDGNITLGTGSISSGIAMYGTSALAAGSHLITGVYSGDTNYNGSTSSPLTQTINQANSSVAIASSSNPSALGSPVTFTATMTPSAATGTVAFLDGSTTLGTATISSGNSTYTTSNLTGGSHSITASYSGDANDNGSASVPLVQTVNQSQCSSGYQYSQAIVFNHLQVSNSDQTDFPVLISGTYSFLATIPNSGQVQSSDGFDIVFCSDAGGTAQLDHEIDTYNPITGAVNFWVRIPTLSHTTDTTIYLFYGNPNVTTSQRTKQESGRIITSRFITWVTGPLWACRISGPTQGNLSNSYQQTGFQPSPATGQIGGATAFTGDPNTYLYHESVSAYPREWNHSGDD